MAPLTASIAYLLGDITKLHEILFFVMVIDYLTGVSIAFVQKKLHSSKAFIGVTKKIATLALVALSYQVDQLLGSNGALCALVVGFFIANEFLSIAENCKILGVPMPDVLEKAIAVISKKDVAKTGSESDKPNDQ